MKQVLALLISIATLQCCAQKKAKYLKTKTIAMPNFYRDTGADSIQLIFRDNGDIEANFCHWNNLRHKKDTVYTGDTTYRLWGVAVQVAPDMFITSRHNYPWEMRSGSFRGDKRPYADSVEINGYMFYARKVPESQSAEQDTIFGAIIHVNPTPQQ